MIPDLEKLTTLIEKNEKTINQVLQRFGMNLEQLQKNKMNPAMAGAHTLESVAKYLTDLEQTLSCYSKLIPSINKKLSAMQLEISTVKEDQEKLRQEKFETEFRKKQETSRQALSPLFQWHLQEQWKNICRTFTMHYKIFWKLSEKYARVRQQLADGHAINHNLDFATLENEVQKEHKQQILQVSPTQLTSQDFKRLENRIELLQRKTLQLEQIQRRFCKTFPIEEKQPVAPSAPERKISHRDSRPKKLTAASPLVTVSLTRFPFTKKTSPAPHYRTPLPRSPFTPVTVKNQNSRI